MNKSQAAGVSPSVFGSSGSFWRYLSRCCLNSTIDIFDRFLRDGGRELNRVWPLSWKLCSLSFLIEEFPLREGTRNSLPLLLFDVNLIPQFGANPYLIFHV